METSTSKKRFFFASKGWIVIILLIAIASGGGYFIHGKTGDPYRTFQELDVASYLENANSLRGNSYKLDAVIQGSLGWSAAKGRLFSVEIKGPLENQLLPILIPADFNKINIQKEQRFLFKVQVNERGVLQVLDFQKQ